MDEVFKGLAVLSGSRPRCFESEASLRRFQFKMWLRTDQWPADYFEQAGRLFAATKITMAMRVDPAQLLAGSGCKESPAESFISAIKREQPLFNTTFRNRELLTVPGRADYESLVERSPEDRAEIRDLNILTRWRLRLTNSKAKSTLTNAWYLYQSVSDGVEDRMGLTQLKEVYERRLHQQAFTFVAEDLWPQLLEIQTELDEEVLRPAMQEDEAEWKKYCSAVIYVMQKLKLDEAERLKQATKLAPIAWREFEPISDNEMDTAGIKPASDRHASETKKAQRRGRKIST